MPAHTPLTPLNKELVRQRMLVPPGHVGPWSPLPGVPVAQVNAKHLKQAPLSLVHPVNLEYPGLRLCFLDPPVFVVENFLAPDECDALVALADDPAQAMHAGSPTFGAAPGARTSDSWFLRYGAVPGLVDKLGALLGGVDPTHFEEPQLVRYAPGQQFKWHLDEVPPALLDNGGQRLATTLVYLNDLDDVSAAAGATAFRELGLRVAPRKGMALLFFPAFAAAGVLGSDPAAQAALAAGAEGPAGAGGAAAAAFAALGAAASPPGASAATPAGRANSARAKLAAKKTKGAGAAAGAAVAVAAGQGDSRTLHCGSPTVLGTKWVAQVWAHASPYAPKVPSGNAHN